MTNIHSLDDQHGRDDLDEMLTKIGAAPAAAASFQQAQIRQALLTNLIDLRNEAGLSQADVATYLGLAQSVVSDLENGNVAPRLSTLQRYAQALGRRLRITLDGTPIEPCPAPVQGDDLDEMLTEISANPVASAAYQAAQVRAAVLETLVEARKAARLNQRRLGKLLGISQPAVSALESGSGDTRLSTLQHYAQATGHTLGLRLDVADLVSAAASEGAVAAKVQTQIASAILRSLANSDNRSGMPQDHLEQGAPASSSETNHILRLLVERGWVKNDLTSHTLMFQNVGFIGISIREDHLRGVVTNLQATDQPLQMLRRSLPDRTPDGVVMALTHLVTELTAQFPGPVCGLGLELSGPVDGTKGSVLLAPDLPGGMERPWRGFPMARRVEDEVGLPTVLENDATALATYELLVHGPRHGIVVVNMADSGRGIGVGLVFGDGVTRGADGQTGELGHTIVTPGGARCMRCTETGARRGCLETEATGYAIANRLGVHDLAAAADEAGRGSERALNEFARAGSYLGRKLGDEVTVLNPAKLIVYGPDHLMADDAPSARQFRSALVQGVRDCALGDVQPVFVVAQDWTAPVAAAAVAMNAFVDNPFAWSDRAASDRSRQLETAL